MERCMKECNVCGKKVTFNKYVRNIGVCDECAKEINKEKEKMKEWYADEDEIIISDIPLYNQEQFNELFKKYPKGIIESDDKVEFYYNSYNNGLLTSNKTNETCIFAHDVWNRKAMIPIVSIRKTTKGETKIFVELYMTKQEYKYEYLGTEDEEDEVFFEAELK